MENKSAIEMIYEIHETLKNLEHRFELMEKNINLLHDKTNGRLMEAIGNTLPHGQSVPAKKVPAPIAAEAASTQEYPTSQDAPRQNARVSGKFLDPRAKPIAGIEVTIVNANNDVVKQTKTNRAGAWLSYLPPGHYSAEFIKEGMQPTFRIFQILEGQSEIEIA